MFAHIDADSFFASVLLRTHPEWRGIPLIAAGMGGGCVIAATYDAKAKGVRTGMRISEAKVLCPEAIIKPSDFQGALTASREIENVLTNFSSCVEQMSVDEWFLDLQQCPGGHPKDTETWARHAQSEVQRQTALTVSAGVGPTKTLAKMASEYKKPAGVYVVHDAKIFLEDRPAEAVPGIGRKRSKHAQAHGWKTAWDFVKADSEIVLKLFGRPGLELQQELSGEQVYAVGGDNAPPQSISRCRSFRKTSQWSFVWQHILDHVSYVIPKMRREGLRCRRAFVWVRDGTYHGSRGIQCRFPQPIDTEEALLAELRPRIKELSSAFSIFTQVGVGLTEFSPTGAQQPSLFMAPDQLVHEERIQQAIDTLSHRHGRGIVRWGGAIHQ